MTEHLTVVISTDGTAEIDGVPVPVVPGESLDVAILDTLHGYARGRDAPVTAAITDPDAGHVALVEVAPDGSSTLLEQVPSTDTAPATPATPAPGPAPAPAPEPVPAPVPEAPPRRKTVPQSDDEYQAPGLLQRPLVLGTVGVTVAVLVIGSLVALGTHGPTDGDSQTTGADQPSVSLEPSTPPTPVTVTPTLSSRAYTPPPPSPSPKHTREAKKKRTPPPKPKPTHRTPKATPKPDPEPTPKSTPESDADPAVPTGAVLIRNKKYGYCVDVPGTGKGRPDGKVQDAACEASAADNQRWTLERRVRGGGTRGADLYLIRNAKDGLCFDLPNYGPVGATTPVTEYHCDGTSADNQLWWLDRRPDGAYWIRNQKSGDLCLDVSRTDREAAHTNVTVFPCSDTDDHRWVFRKP